MIDAPTHRKSGKLSFDPTDPIYTHHFESFPVVPGSLIIQTFLHLVREEFPQLSSGKLTIKRFKFPNFTLPQGAEYEISYKNQQFECKMTQQDQTVAIGKISTSN